MTIPTIDLSLPQGMPSPSHGSKWEVLAVATFSFGASLIAPAAMFGIDWAAFTFASAGSLSAAASWMLLKGWRDPKPLWRAFQVGSCSVLMFPLVLALEFYLFAFGRLILEPSALILPNGWSQSVLEIVFGPVMVALMYSGYGLPLLIATGFLGSGLYWLLRRAILRLAGR